MTDRVIDPDDIGLPKILSMPELSSHNFHYTLEAPTSGYAPAMTYVNRDKFYILKLKCDLPLPEMAAMILGSATSIVSIQVSH